MGVHPGAGGVDAGGADGGVEESEDEKSKERHCSCFGCESGRETRKRRGRWGIYMRRRTKGVCLYYDNE